MIAFVADVHIGNAKKRGGTTVSRLNDRCRETLAVFRQACVAAKEAGASTMVVLGDLFDTDDPSPPMVRATLDALKEGPERVLLLIGNHDQHSDQRHDHAMASMAGVWDSRYITVVERPIVAHTGGGPPLLLVPFRSGRATDWLEGALQEARPWAKRPLLCMHLGVSDSQTERDEPWLLGSNDQVHVDTLCDIITRNGLMGAAAGNWHRHMTWEGDAGEPIWQLGALVPTGWNNPGGDEHYGTLAFLTDDGEFRRDIIPGPRYMKFGSFADWQPYAGREDVRARIVVPASRVGMTQTRVERENPMGFCEVMPDEKTTHRRARSAAVAAKATADSDEALAKYVARIEKPDGVTSGEVMERTRGYLK